MSEQQHRFEYRGETIAIWQAPDGRWGWRVDESHIFDGAPVTRGYPYAVFETPERATDVAMAIVDSEIDGD
jgi:hypothetical protein